MYGPLLRLELPWSERLCVEDRLLVPVVVPLTGCHDHSMMLSFEFCLRSVSSLGSIGRYGFKPRQVRCVWGSTADC